MLHIDALTHTYTASGLEARTVLQIDTWTVERGAQVLLRGVSGSGKTTLFNIIAGLLRPTHGMITLDGRALYSMGESARDRFRAARIGYIFQTHHLMPGFTVLENLLMPMQFAGVIPAHQRNERARSLLDHVGLSAHLHHRPNQLSTGQRLRVAVARALVNRPAMLLADEPTAALDPDNADRVMTFLQESCRDSDAALIVASHDPALAARFPTRLDLRAGRLSPESDTSVREPHTIIESAPA
ncbi:MAG: ABC transporter ATP-binding protein [Chloroflexota bacterium]|nr:ABC transporter ATP-binding protein [Chloroflexota bacterium]